MAVSARVFPSFLHAPTVPFCYTSTPSSLRLTAHPANLSTARTVVYATASSEPKKREPRGITKPRPVSPEMQEVVGLPEIPRTEALKRIWQYIKANNLQDPENMRIIICDEKLKNIFAGKDRVGFLEVAKLIGPHFR